MITADQEANLAAANQRAKFKQDKTNPHVVNIEDGRLMPNIPGLRKHPMYRVYAGPKTDNPSERLRWLEGQSRAGKAKLVNSKTEEDTFDVGTAKADCLRVGNSHGHGRAAENRPARCARGQMQWCSAFRRAASWRPDGNLSSSEYR